ncbi:MAG: hypothetical protein ACU0GG_01605 [Paracoccaceae bacterium]
MIDAGVVERCQAYVGRTREVSDSMAREPAEKLAALLSTSVADHLPLCWHWAYFNAAIPPENVGHDGHEKLGLFLPDVPLPRRMWAAGDIEVISPLALGVPAARRTEIKDVAFKKGRSGDLCFVTLSHEIVQDGPALRETQTIVYRTPGQPETALRSADDPVPEGFHTVPDTTLVAYSAITQNGHRIHWDREFCRSVERYPDLVVHGPWLATLLASVLVPVPGPRRYTYRATAPVFTTTPFRVVEDGSSARVERSDGATAMKARA